MKRIISLILVLGMTILLVACGSTGNSGSGTTAANIKSNSKQLTKEEFEQIYTDANKFKGDKVDFYAKIFVPVEKDDKGTYIQAYADPQNSDKNTLIAINDPKLDVKEDDIIHVIGTVNGEQKGTNSFGAELNLPLIIADRIEKSDYATAFAPAVKTINANQQQNQKGYVITVKKIEFAETETRVYISITNTMKNDKINFYTFNTKAVQGNKQFETTDNFEAGYQEPQTEILPGVTTDGILLYPVMDANSPIKIVLEGSCDNYDIDIKPFTFEIK